MSLASDVSNCIRHGKMTSVREIIATSGQSIGVSASTSVLPMNTQD